MATNILVLAGGQSINEGDSGGFPVCLAELEGVSVIESIVQNIGKIDNANYVFAFLDREIDSHHLDRVAKLLVPDCGIVRVSPGVRGSACTALLAASQLKPESSLLIVSANELVDINLLQPIDYFEKNRLDGGAIAFESIHPRYSYVKLNDSGLVCEASQKTPISKNATTGIFWFRSTSEFIESAKEMIRKSVIIDEKYYIAPVFNEMLLKDKKVGVFMINKNQYHPLKTERQLYNYEGGK